MNILPWPEGLTPNKVGFYLQPHVGGAESPLTRIRKTYLLTAPRWIARLSFTLDDGDAGAMDAWIALLKGGATLTRFHDWRRPVRRAGDIAVTNAAAAKGATSIAIGGLPAGGPSLAFGDYLGGDGRPHIVTTSPAAGADGVAVVAFEPPLAAPIAEGAVTISRVTGLFQLVGEDAGSNETAVGEPAAYALDFVEWLDDVA